jgi:hypothetical protein
MTIHDTPKRSATMPPSAFPVELDRLFAAAVEEEMGLDRHRCLLVIVR